MNKKKRKTRKKLKKLKLKQYKIPCDWECYGVLRIEAKSLKEAISKAKKESESCSLPKGYYIDGSFKLNIADKSLLKVLNK